MSSTSPLITRASARHLDAMFLQEVARVGVAARVALRSRLVDMESLIRLNHQAQQGQVARSELARRRRNALRRERRRAGLTEEDY